MLSVFRVWIASAQRFSLQRGGLVMVGIAALAGIGGLGWVARDVTAGAGEGQRPSLLQLLENVNGREKAPAVEPPLRAAPLPPKSHRPWLSPMGRRCTTPNPGENLRLTQMLAGLQTSMRRLRIDPTNFGVRYDRDAFGNPIDPTPQMVVLHETVFGMESAVQTFQTPHPRDEDQVSYHVMIGLDGEVVEALEPTRRAFGAGNSAFNGQWVVTNPDVGGSVNNFALHLSLETPIDGEDNDPSHSGYSPAQYDATAVVLTDWMRRFDFPASHITTHAYVDLGGERADPRSFDWAALESRLAALGMLC